MTCLGEMGMFVGQLFSWNNYEGANNYNACVIGETGSGKTVFLLQKENEEIEKIQERANSKNNFRPRR